MSLKASAPGKIILSGEHSVVYGYPALVAAVGRRLTIINNGRRSKIISNIPIGCGMGSSAALAVAKSALKIGKLDKEKINEMAYKMEVRQHGKPSGVDNTVSTYGGFLWYRKESENLKTLQKVNPVRKFPKIYLMNTGRPIESTKEVVKNVANHYLNRKSYFDTVFRDMEKVTKSFLNYLYRSKADFEDLVMENELLLEKLGVVSVSTKQIIRRIEKIGGAAKVTGAGGINGNSGMIIVFHKDAEKLSVFAKRNKIPVFAVKLGEEGVKIE